MATNILRAPRRGRAAAVAVAVGAVLAAGLSPSLPASAAAPAVPTDLSPTGEVSSNTPVLSWSPVRRAVEYEVQVDDDPGFSSPEFISTTTNTRAVPKSLLRTGEQSWRVRAVNVVDQKSAWQTSDFTISPSAAPTPLSPVGGELLEQPGSAPLLRWEGTRGATSYTVEVDTEDDFIGAKIYSTKTTSLVVPDPLEARAYWWRVTATKSSGVVSLPSAAETFAIGPLDEVVLTSPEDNPDTKVEDVVLDWEPVEGAQYYQLRVSTNQDFTNPIDDQTKIFGTRYSPKVTYDNNQYYWQVRAVDLAGNPTAWTTVQNNFDRVWPDVPAPVHPAEPGFERVDSPLYFQWEPVQHATQYQIDVGTDESFSPGTFESCLIVGTTYTPGAATVDPTQGRLSVKPDDQCVAQPGVVSYWRVRPLDRPFVKSGAVAGVQGLYSPTQEFIYDPAYFVEGSVHPTNGEIVDVPTFRWTPAKPAETYEITLRNNAGSLVKSAETRSSSYTPVQMPRLDPTKGPYTWTLQAIEANGTESLIYHHQFNVSGEVPVAGVEPLTPLSGRPSDQPTPDAPSLTWEPHEGADHYMISAGPAGSGTFFSPQNDDVLGKKLYYPAVTDTSSRFLSGGQFDWRVTAYTAGGNAIASTPLTEPVQARFTVSRLDKVTGQEIALDGRSLDNGDTCALKLADGAICTNVPSTPVLDWDRVPGATLYMVYVSEDASFTNLLEPSNAIPVTSNTRFAPTLANSKSAYADSQAGLAYYWHVRPCKTMNICGPDPVSSSGSASNAFRKASPPVELVSPAHDADPTSPNIATNEITFDWADYFDTNRATTWAATGEKSPQAAMQYRIQVDDSPTFSGTLIDDQKVDQSTYTAFHKLYPEGTLYWRVQAIDAEENGLTWSETRTLVKSSPVAETIAPIGGEHVSGTAPFRWTAEPFSGEYRIEVYRNNDTTFSSPNLVFGKTVKTPAYAWDQPLPAASQPYVWRVRRTDASGNPGAWSVHGTFHSDGAVPSLVAPAAGVYQPADGPLFTWESVPGATNYEVAVREDGEVTTWARVDTAATAWATDKSVPDGRWEWRVTAEDANRNTIGVSPWRGFSVDTTRPLVTQKAPTRSAARAASFTVRFSEPVEGVSSTTMKLFLKGRTAPLRAAVSLDAAGRQATLDPDANLRVGSSYTVRLSSGITDAAGNTLRQTSWTVRAK